MKTFGALMWVLGLLLVLGALFGMDTSIPSYSTTSGFPDRIVNLQLQQLQMLIAHAGMALFVAGVIAHCAGNLAETLGAPTPAAIASATYASQVGDPVPPAATVESDVSSESDEELMQRYGISLEGDQYVYSTYRYARLADAVAYARKQRDGWS